MEDKGAYVFFSKFKWIFIAVVILLVIGIGIIMLGKNKNEGNLKEYLTTQHYKNEGQTYFKTMSDDNSTINYIFSIKANKFTKNIDRNTDSAKENIQLQYNGTKNVSISYYKEDYSNNSISSISQIAEYNIDNGKYKCELVKINGDTKSQCPKIKKEAESFSKEIKKILKEAGINELFTTKNSDDI